MRSSIEVIGRRLALGVAMTALIPGMAWAQSATDGQAATNSDQPSVQTDDTIIVTGTLIRGIAPAGNNVIGVTTDQIVATGATSTNQVLASLPQVGNFFNQMPTGVSPVAGANASNPISRPNLRNLPAANTSGGAQTLVLIDGKRVVGAGTNQVAVDPDILAPGVIERVDALTDGGSAVYGSDALGGVLNFQTKRRFDGVAAGARYGIGDQYRSVDANVMVGKDWGSGGLYVAYGYAHHDPVYGKDRDWVKQIDWNTGVPTGRNCAVPTATIGTTTYVPSGTGLVAGGPNVCDYSDNIAIYPENTLHTAFARLNQELTDSLTFDVTAFYANRSIVGYGGALGTGALGSGATANATLAATSPFYRPVTGANAGLPQTVRFNYAPLFGDLSATQRTSLESYGVAPSLAYEIGGGWQLRTNFSYGYARTSYENAQISAAAQTAALAAGTLNPYNIAGTSSAVASTLLRYDRGYGRNELFDYRAILDGPLFNLPGGEVRAAVGYEHMHDHFQRRITNATTYVEQVPTNYIQKVDSVFGELQIPLVSTENASSIVQELTVSLSGRYDKYSDFGDTFNPKVGLTFKPTDWLILRGNWGKSFTAPSPVDQLGVAASTVAVVPSQFLNASPPGTTPAAGEVGLFVAGTAPGLQPQKATNWSVGGELRPTFFEGLTISASYYRIDLKGTIGRPVGVSLAPFFTGFPDLYNVRPTGQQLAAYLAQFNPANVAFTVANPTSTSQALVNGAGLTNAPVLVTLDTRARNLGTAKLSGLDFAVNYIRDTGFGSIDASFAGNYKLNQKSQANPTAAVVDNLLNEIPRMNFAATLGATVGNLRGQVTWNHTSGYLRADAGTAGAFGQVRVGKFDAINLFFRYDVPEGLLGPDLEFTLNVQNLFDKAPPLYKSTGQLGYDPNQGHAFSIGRIVQVGVSKKF